MRTETYRREMKVSDYRITKEQRAYLDSLVCQRISDDPANKATIEKFTNERSISLPAALKHGWNQDKKDKLAYYIVKEPGEDGEPLLFFSLKCGEITQSFNRDKLRTVLDNSEALLDAAYGKEAPEWAKEIVEKCKVNGELSDEKFDEFYTRHLRNLIKWNSYITEIRQEGENIILTKQTMPGVELVHFCDHWPAKLKWNATAMGSRSMGRAMFWKFVVPVIQQVRDLVGCEYLYLFAADAKKNGRLVNYYTELGFEIREDLNVSKPEYDFGCFFMCQKVTSLRNRQKEFFRNYNNPFA